MEQAKASSGRRAGNCWPETWVPKVATVLSPPSSSSQLASGQTRPMGRSCGLWVTVPSAVLGTRDSPFLLPSGFSALLQMRYIPRDPLLGRLGFLAWGLGLSVGLGEEKQTKSGMPS